MRQDTTDAVAAEINTIPVPPLSLWLEHEEAHRAFHAELAQQPKPTRPRKRKPTLAGVARQAALPPTLPPRLICRDAAAAYVGVSPNTFDKMIADGLMPSPRRLTERRLAWDMRQLDTAIDRLPIDGDAEATPTQPMITVGMT